ncbi:MAG: hypothetical protein ACO1OB_05125 [Archangium sp.]
MLATEQLDSSAPHAFDATRENLGMVAMGVIVLVMWLLFRTWLKRTKAEDAAKASKS